MLNFREINIEDKSWISELLQRSNFRGCEYCFANNLAWQRLSGARITRYKDFYLCASFDNEDSIPSFCFPAGSGDLRAVLLTMQAFAREREKPLRIWNVHPTQLPILEKIFPTTLCIAENRDSWDYVYLREKLANLSGKRYHQKRNFLHRFSQYGASYAPLTEQDFEDCIVFAASLYNDKLSENHSGIAEQYAIDTYFRHYSTLGLQGGTLRDREGELLAFCIGEPLSSDTFCVHIEKANTKYQGVYVAINQGFAQSLGNNFIYINREEDLGIEGLRKAKLSYHPEFLQEKYCVTIQENNGKDVLV